ncbi:hypothetical protein TPHA_0B04280 [Tetrapisispora phaffii CBS 4417]|uniref:Pterin-binding domain-containing protein n=1 Tax=Tetrapisispora phaffii (strain ATCC 24235 / CBS 4417 / NBRC 1672 / NRRL Y-8282 / UCD 70-5) TaxID=1071381 RepID=G8BQ16_TETPH|nr:hypothetical protein TPHA_0B04280 [Tetrapisispora phaffii CBS 4417]CCE62097.1 hypothetical protein TPHA_0B04280 [Tetrapisispora phaffii CBS 4417]
MSINILKNRSINTSRQLSGRTVRNMSQQTVENNKDVVYIKKLELATTVGTDAWNQMSKQKLLVSLKMETDFRKAASNDDLNYTLNYALISKQIENFVNNTRHGKWDSLGSLSRNLSTHLMKNFKGIEKLNLQANLKSSHLRCNDFTIAINSNKNNDELQDELVISNLHVLTLIGVYPFERLNKQNATLDIIIPWQKKDVFQPPYKKIIDKVVDYVENSNFLTVEALVENVAKVISMDKYFKNLQNKEDIIISVKVLKLNAITQTEGVGVSCKRNLLDLDQLELPTINNNVVNGEKNNAYDLPSQIINNFSITHDEGFNTVYLAFGSNVGDVFSNIVEALKILSSTKDVTVSKVSSLFQSNPMYFGDQRKFINGVLEVKTKLNPDEVLQLCKKIEYEDLKRVKHFDNGPRSIDLDIILFMNSKNEDIIVSTENLVIPHPRMLERSFVLEPLCELLDPTFSHPITTEPILKHLESIYRLQDEANILWKVTPIINKNHYGKLSDTERFMKYKNNVKLDPFKKTLIHQTVSPTYLMSIVNTTPDSFSDGGHIFNEIEKQMKFVETVYEGTKAFRENIIFDIGGCSTRPNSIQCCQEEEIDRTIPLIKGIRNNEKLDQSRIIISIDTYRAEVARQAIEAGVDIINDISGGSFDAELFDVVAKNPQISYVLSHIRGDISTMSSLNEYEATPSQSNENIKEYLNGELINDNLFYPLIRSVCYELAKRYQHALQKGVKRWQIIIDPGLGFSKKGKQNLEIIKQLPLIKNYSVELPSLKGEGNDYVNFANMPILVGPSRKKFIGDMIEESEPVKRDFATGAMIASCVGFDTNIVRVHNAVDCSKVLKIADELYRSDDLQ